MLFTEARMLSSELSSPIKIYVRLYYMVRLFSSEINRALRVISTRYWDLLMDMYSEELRGSMDKAERIAGELESLKRIAENYAVIGELLGILASMMEDAGSKDLEAPWPMLTLARSIVDEAGRVVGKASAMLLVELGSIRDLLDLLLAGRNSETAGEAESIILKAKKTAEAKVNRLMPRPLLLSEGSVSSLA